MDITAIRGDQNVYDIKVMRQDEPVNCTGAKLWFTAKFDKTDPDSSAAIKKNSVTNPNDIFWTDAFAGEGQFIIFPGETNVYTRETTLYYDVQLKEASGKVTTIQKGLLTVTLDVTVATN